MQVGDDQGSLGRQTQRAATGERQPAMPCEPDRGRRRPCTSSRSASRQRFLDQVCLRLRQD